MEDARNRVGKTSAQRGHARHVHAGFAFGIGAAEDYVVDFVRGDRGIFFPEAADYGGR